MKQGLLLINLGTPSQSSTSAVRQFLRAFLADKRVITLPGPLRTVLLYGVILPFRTRKTTKAYQSIWTDNGSPLLHESKQLAAAVQARLPNHRVALGMRYGDPCIVDALKELDACESITVLPLYPQYSSSATGSALEVVLKTLSSKLIIPSLTLIRDFYQHPAYVQAQAAQIQPYLKEQDYLLMSYHGLPEQHIQQIGCAPICNGPCPSPAQYAACYRAQCYQTSTLLAQKLSLQPAQYGTAFQSRLGKAPWIKPYTDSTLSQLASHGIKRLAIASPSFVVDCLETLEELGDRATAQWLALGGEQLTLIPSLNHNPTWIDAVVEIVGS